MDAKPTLSQLLSATIAAEQILDLKAIENLLTLAWHRNKNQHRRSKWWAEFGVLRRGLRRLMAAAQICHGRDGSEEVGARIKFLREEVLGRCWL